MREELRRILFVHKCVGCNKILDKDDFHRAFCFDCREVYLASKMEMCPQCSLEAKECSCMPKLLKKDARVFRKLFFYDKSKRSQPQNRLIYYLKRNKSKRVVREAARELETLIKAELEKLDDTNEAVLACVPRSRGSAAVYGFDQSELICKALSELCNMEFVQALKRKRGKPQKMLTAGERRKNIGRLLFANEKVIDKIDGKTVILIDDVVTTGASMSACIEILSKAGAKRFICVALSSDINP